MQNRGVCLAGGKKNWVPELNKHFNYREKQQGAYFSPPFDKSQGAHLFHLLASSVLLEQIAAVHDCLKRKTSQGILWRNSCRWSSLDIVIQCEAASNRNLIL